jgi:hypothetical protein
VKYLLGEGLNGTLPPARRALVRQARIAGRERGSP